MIVSPPQGALDLSHVLRNGHGFAYNFDALINWRMAKARIDAGIQEIINLNIIGDSISEGVSDTTSPYTIAEFEKAWVSTFRSKVQARFGDAGEGFIPNRYPYEAEVGRWAYTGTWTDAGVGWCNTTAAARKTTEVGATASLDFNGTGVILMARQTYSAKVNVAVDGGAPEEWNTYGQPNGLSTHTISGLADGAHTVVLTMIDSAPQPNSFELFGGYELKGDAGIRVNRIAVGGNQIHTINTYPANTQTCIDHWAPKLTIIGMIANDYNAQTPLDEYKRDFKGVIEKAQEYGEVVVMSIGAAHTAVRPIPVERYKNVAFELALSNNCAFLDIAQRWGGTEKAVASGYLFDGVHPTIPGHKDIANAVAEVLL